MTNLTQLQVKQMSKAERISQLDKFEDMACNTDYIKNPIEYEVIARNINLLEQKILHKEF